MCAECESVANLPKGRDYAQVALAAGREVQVAREEVQRKLSEEKSWARKRH